MVIMMVFELGLLIESKSNWKAYLIRNEQQSALLKTIAVLTAEDFENRRRLAYKSFYFLSHRHVMTIT